MGKGMRKTEDDRELARRLFVIATAMLEDAIEIAAAGQASKRRAAELVELAERLQTAVRDIAAISEGIAIIASRRPKSGGCRPQERSR